MKFKMNLEGVEFNVRGFQKDVFGNETLNADVNGHIGKLEIEAEASIEEMMRDIIPHLKDAIKASIEKK